MKLKAAFTICFAMLLCAFPCHVEAGKHYIDQKTLQEIIENIPRSTYEVDLFANETKNVLEKSFYDISYQNSKESTFQSTLLAYDMAGKNYFSNLSILASLETIYVDKQLAEYGKYKCVQLWDNFFSAIEEESFINPMLTYIEKRIDDPKLNSSELYYIQNFISSQKSFHYSPPCEKRLQLLAELVKNKASTPFTLEVSDSSHEKISDDKHFSLLCWNICALPGSTSMLFGGIIPWKLRKEAIVNVIRESQADVVCLQEVFTEEMASYLIENLKKDYTYFFANIGPRNMGLDDGSVGLGSGLFVASKYKVGSPNWNLYEDLFMPAINRGCFDFYIHNGDKSAHIFTTHLESSITFNSEDDFRKLQLMQIMKLQEKYEANESFQGPKILCGDMNVYRNSQEPAEETIQEFFWDSYSHNILEVNDENCTYCDFTGIWWPEYVLNRLRESNQPKQDILDYVLLFKKQLSGKEERYFTLDTKRVVVNELDHPCCAISDHHALFSIIAWESADN